jgi:hypothetical protein
LTWNGSSASASIRGTTPEVEIVIRRAPKFKPRGSCRISTIFIVAA